MKYQNNVYKSLGKKKMCTNPLDFFVLNQQCKEFIKLFRSFLSLSGRNKEIPKRRGEKKKSNKNRKRQKSTIR